MANIIQGSAVLFEIDLQAEGFSMDENNFDIEIVGAKETVKASKNGSSQDGSLIIFKEDNTWFGILKTENLSKGNYKTIATAYIPDTHVPTTQIRPEIARSDFGTIILP